MTTQNENPVPWGHILGAIGLILILIALNCSKAFGQSHFNYKDEQVGNFVIKLTEDSLYIKEYFVYAVDGHRNLHVQDWTNVEAIKYIEYMQTFCYIHTDTGMYQGFYCDEQEEQLFCDIYYYGNLGEVNYYRNK